MSSQAPAVESNLLSPITLRGLTLRNRVVMSPMCMYSSDDGMANDFHLVHLGSRAIGGVGLTVVEATAVTPDGRISPRDMGLWKDEQIEPLARIVRFVKSHGAAAGIQLAHAGRKASTKPPFEGGGPITPGEPGYWPVVGPSATAFDAGYQTPHALTVSEINALVDAFVAATHRAGRAGFDVVEVHAAHGYLLSEFLSPLANHRTDDFGGSLDNRMRFPLRVVKAVRDVWPADKPLFVRISATDWVEGGWTGDDSVVFARHLKTLGVDLVDCSTGGNSPKAKIPLGPGYQVPFAKQVRAEAALATAAVGLITEVDQANAIITRGDADLVFLARELLRDPYWVRAAEGELGATSDVPKQYGRAGQRRKR